MRRPRARPPWGPPVAVAPAVAAFALMAASCWGSHSPEPSPARSLSITPSGPASAGPTTSVIWTFPLALAGEDLDGATDAVAVGPDGNVYVADTGRARVVVLSPDGREVASWGRPGARRGEFDFEDQQQRVLSSGIAVGSDGSVYVADVGNFRIERFDGTGAFVTAWGSRGSGPGRFERLAGVAVDGAGHVFAIDAAAKATAVQEFDPSGRLLARWGSEGTGRDQIAPGGAGAGAVGPAGEIYIPDGVRDRVLAFDRSGRFLFAFGSPGGGPGQLDTPVDVAVEGNGNVVVADYGNGRIVEFDRHGRFVGVISLAGTPLLSPAALAGGPGGELYISDDVLSVLAKVLVGP